MFRRFGSRLSNKLVFLEGEQVSSGQKEVIQRLEKMKFTTIYNPFPNKIEEFEKFSENLIQNIEKVYKNDSRDNLIFLNGSYLSLLSYPMFKSLQKELHKEHQKLKDQFQCDFILFPTDEYVMKLRIANYIQNESNPLIHLEDIPYILESYQQNSKLFTDTVINA